jgi:hypothetical protein
VLTEGARKIYHGRHGARGRRVGQGCCRDFGIGERILLKLLLGAIRMWPVLVS